MIVHVLPGDALVEEFKKTNIAGQVIVFREAMIVGPVDADTPFEFWDERARFILAEYGEDEIVYHERVADELEKLRDLGEDEEINLWFEYELFCSVNMWFCLSLLAQTKSMIYRVEPVVLDMEDRWKGFGKLDANALKKCYAARQKFTVGDIQLGADLWNAYRKNDNAWLRKLAQTETDCFPYLKEVCEAAIDKDRRAPQIITDIMSKGVTEIEDIFPEFSRRAGVYGYGDLQVQRMLDHISS